MRLSLRKPKHLNVGDRFYFLAAKPEEQPPPAPRYVVVAVTPGGCIMYDHARRQGEIAGENLRPLERNDQRLVLVEAHDG